MPSSGSGSRPDTFMLVTDIDRLMQSYIINIQAFIQTFSNKICIKLLFLTYMFVYNFRLGSKSKKVPERYQQQFRSYMKTAVDWGLPHPWEEKVVKESGRVYFIQQKISIQNFFQNTLWHTIECCVNCLIVVIIGIMKKVCRHGHIRCSRISAPLLTSGIAS